MRILGLYIHKMDSYIQKNLKEGWFPFGDYLEPETDGYVSLSVEKERTNTYINKELYSLRAKKSPNINVCCIAGKNGSGKSTLLDILFRIINNVSYVFLEKLDSTNLLFSKGLNADLHFEIDGILGCVNCTSDNIRLFWGTNSAGNRKEIKSGLRNSYKRLENFFYTISINYSIYAYCGGNNISSNETDWIRRVFHKNDGYLTPLVLAPYRDNNGNIDIENENRLADQRLISLILYFWKKKTQFIPGYSPLSVSWSYSPYYLKNKLRLLCRSMNLGQDKFYRRVDEFRQAWKSYFETEKTYDFGIRKIQGFEKMDKACLSYLAYKTLKICCTYPEFIKLYNDRKEKITSTFDIVRSVVKRDDHITMKIQQCLSFMDSRLYNIAKGDYAVNDFILACGSILSYNQMLRKLLPPFFDVDIQMRKDEHNAHRNGKKIQREPIKNPNQLPALTSSLLDSFSLRSMSSGERQFLHSISYALYHIKNLESVKPGFNRIKYKNINLVLDEAELYYHPDYQRRYIQMLLEALEWCGFSSRLIKSINIIIVTHSPFILSDMVHQNILYLDNGERVRIEGKTFGANYYDLLYNSFFFKKNTIGEVATRVISELIKKRPDALNREIIDILGDPLVKGYLLNKKDNNV